MDSVETARKAAENLHQKAVETGSDPWDLLNFVLQEARRQDIEVYGVRPDDPQLKGGQATFDSQSRIILYADSGSPFTRAFLIAHELGHVIVEGDEVDVVTKSVEPDRSAEEAPVGASKVIDYGAKERREIQMDLFARELLLPRSVATRLHVDESMSAATIAQRLNAPVTMVQQQLLDALLLPQTAVESSPSKPSFKEEDDPSQAVASQHSGSAFLLQAGPGTGKTRTLVRRVKYLLSQGVSPSSILVLTFSNKAALELSERISASDKNAAASMWIGTFHSFGLDIIRRFHERLNLPADPRIIDTTEAVELLEDEFPRLPLKHYRNLWDPSMDIGDILKAISRAQDEVVDAEGYLNLSKNMLEAASNAEEQTQAEKCHEVGMVFKAYEDLKRKHQAVDFGDLIALPVSLVENDLEAKEALKLRHRYILVDEYQDVNYASTQLLKAIAGSGEHLWVVGDARQSIYRFRGAASTNIARFTIDFPNAQVEQLSVNYRSKHEIIDTFRAFSQTMKASSGALALELTASRGISATKPDLRITETPEDEISAVAAAIQEQKQNGIDYCKQAVLCASNANLREMAEGLEKRGIPILHLGSLFERSEIKDILALLSLLTDNSGSGLVRLANLSDYPLTLQDASDILKYINEHHEDGISWQNLSKQVPTLSSASRSSLEEIGCLLEGITPNASPWSILAQWIIDRLGTAKQIYQQDNLLSRMQGFALWQFMNFCRQQPTSVGNPIRRLLERIRRLVLLAEDKDLHRLPQTASDLDAVRLLTIHASKGLEFDVVHIPGLVQPGLPRNNRPPRCLPPDGLIRAYPSLSGRDAITAGHEEEEECLFFVALSRARERLCLYAYKTKNSRRCNRSPYISHITQHLNIKEYPALVAGEIHSHASISIEWEQKPQWKDNQFKLFERCPLRFFYTHVLQIRGRRTETPFLQMHSVVFEMLDWIKSDHASTHPSESQVNSKFIEVWENKGATDHGYADDYFRIGRRLVDFFLEIHQGFQRSHNNPICLSLPECDIVVTPDSLVNSDDGQLLVRHIKTGKKRSNGFDDIEFSLLKWAVQQEHGMGAAIEVAYLTSEEKIPMILTDRKFKTRQSKIQAMAHQINKGNFPQEVSSRVCPRCPNFFICGSIPPGSLRIKI